MLNCCFSNISKICLRDIHHAPYSYSKKMIFQRNAFGCNDGCTTNSCSLFHFNHRNKHTNVSPKRIIKSDIIDGPGLEHFIKREPIRSSRLNSMISHPYLKPDDLNGHGRKVHFEVYGCQMNVSDTEIAWSILKSNGYSLTSSIQDADVIFIMTCSIREGAEDKIWKKLSSLRSVKNKNKITRKNIKIGVLGCMAERLRKNLIEKEDIVDIVAGPDSYKDLPRLLALSNDGESVVNVLLSHDETYAHVTPVSISGNNLSAYVSIMRGCDNMCSYCIVPFTRGRERSRNLESIVDEVKQLSERGVKEVTLLGQNVNSYLDVINAQISDVTSMAKGFKTIYKPKMGNGRFVDLLDKVSLVDPEMRIRFTSPHPKDFPDEVLHLIVERPNICNHIHLPAQCGSSRVLQLMRRGYTREAYIELAYNIRSILPDVALSSDFICGFCSETDEEFEETLTLIQEVKYNFCYVFAYSLREKTHAHRNYVDNVPEDVKKERLDRMAKTFRNVALELNLKKVGSKQLVLIEGTSRRSEQDLVGRSDGNTRVIIPDVEIGDYSTGSKRHAKVGDYIEVCIKDATSQVLKGVPSSFSSIKQFHS